jgi:hypothetical protein
MVLVLLAFGFLPLAADAFAWTDGMVSTTDARSFDGYALRYAARGTENDAAWCPHLRGAERRVDLIHELVSQRAVAPRTELRWVESVDLHADLDGILENFFATIAGSTNHAETPVMSNHSRCSLRYLNNSVEFPQRK